MATLEIDTEAEYRVDGGGRDTTDHGSSIGARILRSRSHFEHKAAAIKTATAKATFKELNDKEIAKLYTNKLSRVKVTPLETIFEHKDECDGNDSGNSSDSGLCLANDGAQIFGKRKVKRAILFSEGMKPTKTLRDKRKKRIQQLLGNRKRFKHMSMRSFLERFEANECVTFGMDVDKVKDECPVNVAA